MIVPPPPPLLIETAASVPQLTVVSPVTMSGPSSPRRFSLPATHSSAAVALASRPQASSLHIAMVHANSRRLSSGSSVMTGAASSQSRPIRPCSTRVCRRLCRHLPQRSRRAVTALQPHSALHATGVIARRACAVDICLKRDIAPADAVSPSPHGVPAAGVPVQHVENGPFTPSPTPASLPAETAAAAAAVTHSPSSSPQRSERALLPPPPQRTPSSPPTPEGSPNRTERRELGRRRALTIGSATDVAVMSLP